MQKILNHPYLKWVAFFIATLLWLLFSLTAQAESLIIEPEMGRAPILSAIKQAKSSVNLVMYGFTDPSFMDALIDKKNSGKEIHVLLQKFPYKNDQENTLAINKFQQAHINLKWPNPDFKLTHQKTLIIDHHNALIMTFNFTHATFKNERNFGLIIDDPSMVNEIEQVFNNDWNYQESSIHHPNLIWSPTNSREKLLQFIGQAKSTIEIYAQSITDYKTAGALAKAAKNGVNVVIITSAQPNKKYDYLTQAGVSIHYSKHYYIHAKIIIVDHQYAMLGSMNLTKASIEDNRELSIITQDKNVIQQLENTFYQDIQQADSKQKESQYVDNKKTRAYHSRSFVTESTVKKFWHHVAKFQKTISAT